MNLPIRRETIAEIVGRRDKALTLYARAHGSLRSAYEDLAEAMRETPGQAGATSYDHRGDANTAALLPIIQVPTADAFIAAARFATDRQVWGHLVAVTNLERLMDKSAKEGLRQQLFRDPPEISVGNITATLEQFVLDADTIFKRGLATAFSELDRRFRSHDGWKIGGRVILDRALSEFGDWNHYTNKRDSLQDIERVFHVLDGKQLPPSYTGIVGAIDKSRRGGGFGHARQSEAGSDYFTARCFKNGNLHLWFKRNDLLVRVNRLLGEYYGAAIPEDREADEDDGLSSPKTSLAKGYGFFPTPDAPAEILIEAVRLYRHDQPPATVLEPSAGLGNLATRCADAGAVVDCVEVHPERATTLAESGRFRRVVSADFLRLKPNGESYDRIVMNPPFDRERDIDHVVHAINFLKPDGRLAAIVSAGTEFRETRKAKAFRALMADKNADWRDLPAGSFAASGTYCNTAIVSFWNDGRRW